MKIDLERDCIRSDDDKHRYWLARNVVPLTPSPLAAPQSIIYIGINPSTARGIGEDDASQRKMNGFSLRLGAIAYGIINPFARSTKDVDELFDRGYAYAVGPENDKIIKAVFAAARARRWPVVAAWGALSKIRPSWRPSVSGRLYEIVCMADDAGIELQCLATTEDGWPRHPLMLGYEPTRLTPWKTVI